jgi:hypothetical protein
MVFNSNMDIAILVVSCDKYSDMWRPFFNLFKKNWADCPFRVYLITNHQTPNFPGVTTIPVGEDRSWSDSIITALPFIVENFVLMFIDDLFLVKTVDTPKLLNILRAMIEIDASYLRLNPTVKADKPCNQLFGIVSPGTIYRTSTVLSVWKKNVLQTLLKPGENAWEFEIIGTTRADANDGFYAAWRPYFAVFNGVIKGKWRRGALLTMDSQCHDIDFSHRDIMTWREEIVLRLQIKRGQILNLLPSAWRRSIKDRILGGKYRYGPHVED